MRRYKAVFMLCVAVATAAAVAPTSGIISAHGGVSHALRPDMAKSDDQCSWTAASAPNLTYDPVLGITSAGGGGAQNLLSEEDVSSTPASLLQQYAGTTAVNGIQPGDGAVSLASQSTTEFAAGYSDEAELYEHTDSGTQNSVADYDNSGHVPGLSDMVTPIGNVENDTSMSPWGNTPQTGHLLPYVAVFDSSGHQVAGGSTTAASNILVHVVYENYVPVLNGGQQHPQTICDAQAAPGFQLNDHLYALMTFNLQPLIANGTLTTGENYTVYFLLRETDQSGPLSDHEWTFTAPPCSGSNCPCTGSNCPCTGSNCPCTGSNCPCTGSNCPCTGSNCPCTGSNCPCTGSNCPCTGSASACPPPVVVYTGYANSPLPCGCDSFPRENYRVEWYGHTDANTFFVGTPGPGNTWDSGGVAVVNTSSDLTIKLDEVVVKVGDEVFSPWGSGTLGPGQAVIFAQTLISSTGQGNFDTSDVNTSCSTPNANAPVIVVETGGTQYKFIDNARVLDTGGVDVGECFGLNETHDWTNTDYAGAGTFIDP